MKFHPHWAVTALFTVALGASSVANAALVDRGGGLIYDQDLNITWLANANVNGLMTWNNAMTWASNLSYYDSVRNVTYTDWRLPTSDTCFGLNCTGSEMGHLFYTELGGTAGSSILSSTDPDLALFTNVQSYFYWSGTEYAPFTLNAWTFLFGGGYQDANDKSNDLYAWAVRPGDVAAVPVPAAAWLFGSGLLGLIGFARRKKQAA
jgi:hypothetical protein